MSAGWNTAWIRCSPVIWRNTTDLFNIVCCLGRRLQEDEAVLLGKLLALLCGDCAPVLQKATTRNIITP
jgi:hypothetical protein